MYCCRNCHAVILGLRHICDKEKSGNKTKFHCIRVPIYHEFLLIRIHFLEPRLTIARFIRYGYSHNNKLTESRECTAEEFPFNIVRGTSCCPVPSSGSTI